MHTCSSKLNKNNNQNDVLLFSFLPSIGQKHGTRMKPLLVEKWLLCWENHNNWKTGIILWSLQPDRIKNAFPVPAPLLPRLTVCLFVCTSWMGLGHRPRAGQTKLQLDYLDRPGIYEAIGSQYHEPGANPWFFQLHLPKYRYGYFVQQLFFGLL